MEAGIDFSDHSEQGEVSSEQEVELVPQRSQMRQAAKHAGRRARAKEQAAAAAATEKKGKRGKPAESTGPAQKQILSSAKAKAKASGTLWQCMGCAKKFSPDQMANKRYCPKDKKITDKLYAAAKIQGKSPWLSDQLSCMSSSVKLCSAYKEKYGSGDDATQLKAPTGKFINNYYETLKASTGVRMEGFGIMMTQARYVLEMQDPKKGPVPEERAKRLWDDMYHAPGAIKDIKDGEKRVRVNVDDYVVFENKVTQEKGVTRSASGNKKGSLEDLKKMASTITSNHE
eukprot:987797-Pyramimonas_sp.AAC.1